MPFISPYATSSIKAATIRLAVASPASPMSDDMACKFPTVVFGSRPNHDWLGPTNTPSTKSFAAVPPSKHTYTPSAVLVFLINKYFTLSLVVIAVGAVSSSTAV